MKDKIHLVSDKTKNSLKVKTYLTKKVEITSLKKSNIIIVLGGDGFMLQTLKKLYKFKKPFYGINSGNYGFLMNKFSNKKNIIKNLISDGVLVSTPAGSTAYNLSAHGPILNLDSNRLAVTPISPFRPRRWRGITVSFLESKFRIGPCADRL